jgi:hypothetical protein
LKRFVVVIAAALTVAPSALAAKPVPSLTPAATAKLWRAEVSRAKAHPRRFSDAGCRPARVVFYAQTDWLRLATKLAQTPSPCAQYYVSVPPLAADKSQARAGQAALIRALGPNFHAVDEISWNGWNAWLTANASTWFQAGVTARQRMTAAGFDTSAGDAWALNELSSAVRKGTGTARRDALDFLHGLSNDGVKGIVFAAGVGQSTPDLSSYKVNLQGWLQDAGFWSEAAGYVSDWAQENYGDVRDYAVAGSTAQQRRDALAQYLGHELALANAGPDAAGPARDLLRQAYVTFGNAAWAWSGSYGWTAVPLAAMQDFVSGQVYADRAFAAAGSAAVDRFGFAWAPSNTQGLAPADFNAQSGSVLDRMAAAIRDSGVPSDDVGAGACVPGWCSSVVDGAVFTTAWQAFSTWSTPAFGFASAPFGVAAGAVAGPVAVQLQTNDVPVTAPSDQAVALTTTSPSGAFSTAPTGPWSPTLSLTIPTGASTASFYYTDTLAGSPTLSASGAAQVETVTPGAVAKLAIAPGNATVAAGNSQSFTVTGSDAYGNVVLGTPTWTLSSSVLGRLLAAADGSALFTAGTRAASGSVTATVGTVTASAPITVTKPKPKPKPSPQPRVAGVGIKMVSGHLVATARVLTGARPAAGVALLLHVRKGSSTVARVQGRTRADGTLRWRSAKKLPRAAYVAKAVIRSRSTASRTQH